MRRYGRYPLFGKSWYFSPRTHMQTLCLIPNSVLLGGTSLIVDCNSPQTLQVTVQFGGLTPFTMRSSQTTYLPTPHQTCSMRNISNGTQTIIACSLYIYMFDKCESIANCAVEATRSSIGLSRQPVTERISCGHHVCCAFLCMSRCFHWSTRSIVSSSSRMSWSAVERTG